MNLYRITMIVASLITIIILSIEATLIRRARGTAIALALCSFTGLLFYVGITFRPFGWSNATWNMVSSIVRLQWLVTVSGIAIAILNDYKERKRKGNCTWKPTS